MKVTEYKNVFLTRSGIGLKKFRLVNETIHLYKSKRIHFWKYALYQYFFRKKIRLNGRYFVIHNHWCPGYYHWITEALPRLLKINETNYGGTLVLPESFKQSVYDSVKPLYEADVFWIPQKQNLVISNLIVPENPPLSGKYDKITFLKLRALYSHHAQVMMSPVSAAKVYVSRAKAARRKVINESEVINCVEDLGFLVIHFEDYSFWEQVLIMRQTEVFISIHGAGLSNVLFMKEGARVIELQKGVEDPTDKVDVLYKDFAELLGLQYDVLFCQPLKKGSTIYQADIIVDLQSLKSILP